MPTKTCRKCGWVLDLYDKHTTCPICKTPFEERVCKVCGKPFLRFEKNYYRNVCKECLYEARNSTLASRKHTARKRAVYQEWKDKISKIPKSYPTLTEAQWLNAVRHFGRCAICEDESIDARGYFIPFEEGGRYCDWNVIPICSKCAMRYRKVHNLFLSDKPPGLIGIIEYLEPIVDKALRESADV